jgi:hypothetical protein
VITVDHYQSIIADIVAQQPTANSFDVGLIGNAAGTLPTPESLQDYSGAGVTWLLVQALTVDDAVDRAWRGPPRPT